MSRQGHLSEILRPSLTALCFTDGTRSLESFRHLLAQSSDVATPLRTIVIGPRRPQGHSLAGVACDIEGRAAALYDAAPGTVYLLRPDGHVLARWRSPSTAAVRPRSAT